MNRAISLAVCVVLGACAEASTESTAVDLPAPRDEVDAGFLVWDAVSDEAAAKTDEDVSDEGRGLDGLAVCERAPPGRAR